jgi:hypothetical protein
MIQELAKMGAGLAGAATGAIVDALSPEAKLQREQFKESARRLRQNQLGLSQAAQNQIAGEALANATAQQRGLSAEMARSAAAQGGKSGAMMGALGKQQAGVGQAAAAAQLGAAQQSAALAAQEKAQILAEARQRRADRMAQFQNIAASLSGAGGTAGGSGGEDYDELHALITGKKKAGAAGSAFDPQSEAPQST